uniref:Cyclic nucleotide-binding domain-containing protein n=1 Tax=Elaeophora elaphi TaxID=1147741 RepID=A0A0R3RJE2_9BILA
MSKFLLFQFVAVFQSGDQIFYWYLLLSGEVQLFLSTAENERIIETLQPIALFGELSISRHSCSARVIRSAEIVTINQNHFIAVYNQQLINDCYLGIFERNKIGKRTKLSMSY